jgi:hypothetical protein
MEDAPAPDRILGALGWHCHRIPRIAMCVSTTGGQVILVHAEGIVKRMPADAVLPGYCSHSVRICRQL